VGGVTVYLHVEDMSATRHLMVWCFHLRL
jgi:hypothetical protein